MQQKKSSDMSNPKLILVHGFLDNAALWQPLVDRLDAEGYECVTPDLAGAGSRQSDPGPYTLDRAVKDILSYIGSDSAPVVIIGHSMGAQIAELAAMELKDKVSALVLLTPTPLEGNTLPDTVRSMLRDSGGNALAQQGIRQAFSRNLSEQDLLKATAADTLMGLNAARGYYDAFTGGHSAGFTATQCTAPILILGAEEDPVIGPEMVRRIHMQRFPLERMEFISNSGHWPHIEQAQATSQAIASFLKDVT